MLNGGKVSNQGCQGIRETDLSNLHYIV